MCSKTIVEKSHRINTRHLEMYIFFWLKFQIRYKQKLEK